MFSPSETCLLASIMTFIFDTFSPIAEFSDPRIHSILRQCSNCAFKRVRISDSLTPLVKNFIMMSCATDEGTSRLVMAVLRAESSTVATHARFPPPHKLKGLEHRIL
ncbi:uncharacterized protein LOC143204733 [Rhynchophorus ferrugineus]|uniref:uncharacterized protein LOC143204733 n=1 Tax=Rhynchophorus ferrugineus TaxID=354439 RepID=UPI003FCCDFA8